MPAMPANNSAHERPLPNEKHHHDKPNASRWEEDYTTVRQQTTGQAIPANQNRRPSVTFDLPPLRQHQGNDLLHQPQHRKRVSTHSKTSSIGSVGGQSFTSSTSSSVSCSSSAAAVSTLNTASAASPARRQLRKKQRASTISSFTVLETTSSTMRFGMKIDFNKRSSKRFSQDSLGKELPPLPHEVFDKRVSGQLPLPPLDTHGASKCVAASDALSSSQPHEDAVLHIKKNGRRRSSLKNRADLPPLPSEAAQHQYRAVSMLNKAEHLAEVKRQTELWLSMLCNSGDGDNLFTHSLSPSSSNSSLNGKSAAPSSHCCDPDFLDVEDSRDYAKAVPQLPIPYTSPILRSPFTDGISTPLNPFEASFMASRTRQVSSEVVLPNKRRSSLPTHLLMDNSHQKRLDKHRPPPLNLVPIQDSPAEEESAASQTALPAPQYRSRSLSHDLRPLDPLSIYHRRFHRSSQDTTDLSTSVSRSRENSVSSSSAASMIFTSSNDSSIDNGSTGRRFSCASSNMPSPKSPNHPRTPTLQDLLEEGPTKEAVDTVAAKESNTKERMYPGTRHGKQGSTGSVEVVMYGVAR